MPVEDAAMSGSGSCGLPAPYRQCRIVGPDGNDVARGEVGELWVSGRAILKGYYNKPEATRDALSGDWFRTGDLFRQDDNGYFYIEGRIKDSIRSSGENISAREIESVAAGIAGVLETAALGGAGRIARRGGQAVRRAAAGLFGRAGDARSRSLHTARTNWPHSKCPATSNTSPNFRTRPRARSPKASWRAARTVASEKSSTAAPGPGADQPHRSEPGPLPRTA